MTTSSARPAARPPETRASDALLAAALGGLLSLALPACSGDDEPASDDTLSSVVDPAMTLEKFTALCDERAGTVELHAHCGGVNSCKGLSYDDTTQVLTEHTCRGKNTCSGYSCVIP